MTSIESFLTYVESVRSRPFSWGTHDCLMFANNAVRSYRGKGFADDWLGIYTSEISALDHYTRQLHECGFSGIVDAVDSRLDRLNLRIPPRASVAARPHSGFLGYAFGVVVSDRVAFVGKTGLSMTRAEPHDLFWSVTQCHN